MKNHIKCGAGSGKAFIGMMGLVATFFFIALCPLTVYAHPPKEVTLVYNMTSQRLEVTVIHETSFPGFHYIKQIEIKKKGGSISAHDYESQPTKSKFTYTYDVPAAQGDVLEVTASCNLYGSKTVTVTVGKQEK